MESPTPTDLIDRHCPCLEGRVSLDLLSPLQLNASHEWIRLGPIGNAGDVNSDYQETQDFRIRLAMDVLNTVATCTGFDPRSNTTFWQSLLLRLSPLTPQDKRYAWAPFDHDLFSRFELEFDAAAYGSNNSLPRLEQLWMEIFAPNERFCRQRDQILAPILQETMRPIPPLRFRLVFLRTAVTKASWMDAVVRSSERLSQDVEVVMRDKVLDQKQLGSLPLATLVSPPMIALRDVTVCLPLIGKVGSYEFLHALILHQSSRVSRLVVECVGRVDFLDLSAVCSALPYAHALEELLLTNYIFRKSKAGPALSWVHYAWTNPRCLDGRSSLKRLMIDSHEYLTRHQSLNTEYPLQKAVGKALAKMYRYTSSVGADIWYPIGSTITAPSDLAAYSKPESIGTPTHTIPASSQLDVVVKMKERDSDQFLGVVVPGRGLLWISRALEVVPPPKVEARPAKRRRGVVEVETFRERGLIIGSSYSTQGLPLARMFDGAHLTALCLCSDLDGNQFANLLKTCPRLVLFKLNGSVASTQPLVDAYHKSRCRITSLALLMSWRGEREAFTPLWAMLSDPKHPGTHYLKELTVGKVDLAALEQALGRNGRLERLKIVFMEDFNEVSNGYSTDRLCALGQGRGKCSPSTSLAFLSVVSANPTCPKRRRTRSTDVRINSVRTLLDEPLLRNILGFVGNSRHVAWIRQRRSYNYSTEERWWQTL